MNKKTIILIAASVAVVVALAMYYKKYGFNSTENFKIQTLYSEPSLTCELGGSTCTLSTGKSGVCDVGSDRCIEVPVVALPIRPTYNMEPPIGEISPDCQWRGVCTRSDGESGVCMNIYCYPSSINVR